MVIGEDDIRRIAMAVKLSIQEELADLVNHEVAEAVQPLHARITKLEETNILDITSKAGIPLQRDDIINSHRAGTPNINQQTTAGLRGPRQIIARLRSMHLKFRLVKSL